MRKAEKGAACSWRNCSLMDSPCKDRDMMKLWALAVGAVALGHSSGPAVKN